MIAGIVAAQHLGPPPEPAPDTTAPTITSSNTASVQENAALVHALTANEAVTWSLVGGADQARFELSGSTLRWLSNGTKNFEAPDDADTNNTYVVTVRATDTALNTSDQTITVTVTDVDEVAPTLSSATGTETGATTADLSVSTNEGNGTLYWVVTQSVTGPTKAQVKAGEDHNDDPADDADDQAVSGTGVQNAGASGLTAETEYWAHFMHEDAATNQSDVAASASFTTEAPGAESHRYWRLFVTDNNGDASFISLAELEMSATEFGVNQCTGGTASASTSTAGLLPAEAFDQIVSGVDTNAWASSSGSVTDQWLQYDFGSNKEVVSIVIHPQAGLQFDRAPNDIKVEYSDNGTDWTTYWTDTLVFSSDGQALRSTHPDFGASYSESPYGAHTYWRILFFSAHSGAISAAEAEFRATTGGADQATGGTPTVSSTLIGTAADIFDNNASTHWAINGGPGAWIKYQFASAVEVGEISYQIRGDSNPSHAPKTFCIQYSDDNTVWTTAWQVLNEPTWTNGQTRVFTSPDYI